MGPTVNILAISFTGMQIGLDIALVRIILARVFVIIIGLLMAWIFREGDQVHAENVDINSLFAAKAKVSTRIVVFFLLLLWILLARTLQIGLFRNEFIEFSITSNWAV